MSDRALSKLFDTQISLTEWLARIDHKDAKTIREEDNVKRVRLGDVCAIIGLPYDMPTTFVATDITKRTRQFQSFLEGHANELCALRLIPKPGMHAEKLRNRGKSIREAVAWFEGLEIDPDNYLADFVPHASDNSWATIFVVNDQGIFGEIYLGGHHILTQGFHEKTAPMAFGFDFKKWTVDPPNKQALKYLKELVRHVYVPEKSKQTALRKKVGAEFAHDYMKGYFETTHSQEYGTWFIDYNRTLGTRYSDYAFSPVDYSERMTVRGRVASGGESSGVVRIVNDPLNEDIEPGEILVCPMTTPDFIPLMIKSGGIVTDQGGILCHAAIVARELGKPCIVGTKRATHVFKSGDHVTLDLNSGEVRHMEATA